MNIIITGASKGIGKAIATAFAKEGNKIIINSRNEAELLALATKLSALHNNTDIQYYTADLSVKENCLKFANWCIEKLETVDILVNNVGYYLPGAIHNEPEGQLEAMLQANLLSAYHITRVIVPNMIAANKGYIVNISSIAGIQPYANGGSYSISKYAVQGFSKNLREELKQHNIKVSTIVPGAAYTNSWSGSGVAPERIMEAADIATMIVAATKLSPQAVMEEIVLRPQLGDL